MGLVFENMKNSENYIFYIKRGAKFGVFVSLILTVFLVLIGLFCFILFKISGEKDGSFLLFGLSILVIAIASAPWNILLVSMQNGPENIILAYIFTWIGLTINAMLIGIIFNSLKYLKMNKF